MRLIRILTFSNFWVALGAAAFCQSGYLFLGGHPKADLLTLFCFLSCWSVYLLIRVAALQRIREYDQSHRWRFFLDHIRLFQILTVAGLLAVAVLFFFLPSNVQYVLLVPGVISLLYGLPLTAGKRRLRDIGILKIFLISFVWGVTGSYLPAAADNQQILGAETNYLFLAQFLFIFSNALLFDINDLAIDAKNQVRTIPYYLGEESTYTLSFVCLFAAGGIHLTCLQDTAVPACVSILLSGMMVYLSRKVSHDQVLFFGIDSWMLLQFLLLWTYLVFH